MDRFTLKSLSLFAFSFFMFLILLTTASFAQNSGPPLIQPNGAGGWDFTPLLNELQHFVTIVFLTVLSGLMAVLLKPINAWFGTHIQAGEIVKDLKMGEYANIAVGKALDYAKQKTGLNDAALKDVEIRNPVLSLAAGFLFKQYPEVWTWAANTEKGVMQYIESHLPPEAALPPNVVEGVGPVALTSEVTRP